ncbi:PH domain-containing protein [Paenibacillus radicis (ex Xue et al. 2023)]|uniref:PH domain-containing protein n=1 Tax=Paenibacillus radicis (ex Xue et al. 2023) TaxID=2972489 RepID=A0ABT1YIP3_9BACL|nr:PH domain-containing protein [Paenibacillus radicis (ex Xue et al. 2023)]MCR8632847.1 PH domain-containing protein [Paenibacillus radicis (ex Xue et al. 2023)]
MHSQPSERIDQRAIAVWQWGAAITSALLAAVGVGAIIVSIKFAWPWWIPVLICAAVVLEMALDITIMPPLRWKRWRYEIREEEIDLLQGVIFVTRTVIPMVRIQHVDTHQGPILRKYGLTSVTFSTAAGKHHIPALADDTAARVRKQIAELARVTNEDV